jgi:hypothetical protein
MSLSSEATSEKPEFISKFTKGWKFEPPKIDYDVTRERLTGKSGVGNIIDLFTESAQYPKFRELLPERTSNSAYDSVQYGLCLLAGFWLGADCLEDVEKYKKDSLLVEKLGGARGRIPTARAIGSWLRDFDESKLLGLSGFLSKQAIAYRRHLKPGTPLVLDMDSTSHPQTGLKIEGVDWNFKNEWALDSLSCFDDMGLCYDFKLRPGSTHTSVGAVEMLTGIVSTVRECDPLSKEEIYFRADSGFCNESVFRGCLNLGVKFTITAHGNLKWENSLKDLSDSDWQPWEYSFDEIKESKAKKKSLPTVEVAQLFFTPSWGKNIRFKLVVKREWIKFEEGTIFEGDGYWNHYGVLTNITDYLEKPQSIIEHHCMRGNAENRIKAFKGDYDLRHLPCLKMNANYAYAMLGMVALNFHRALSLVEDPRCPRFSKSFRERLIKIPGRLVRHARALKIKIEEHWLEEVKRLYTAWHDPPRITLTFKLRLKTA